MTQQLKTLEKDLGFTAGLWYAVELLTVYLDKPDLALVIIKESGIRKAEFEEQLKQTGFEVELLTTEILNKINDDGSIK